MSFTTPPSFFSVLFHTRFFPELLRRGLQPTQGHFHPHVFIEFYLGVFLSIIAGVLSLVGFLALLVFGVRSGLETPVLNAELRPAIFVFFVLLGGTLGAVGGELAYSHVLAAAGAVAGLCVGYCPGIFAGPLCAGLRPHGGLCSPYLP